MASYARTHAQVSVLAQAKPAIISASTNDSLSSQKDVTSALGEELQSSLKFSPKIQEKYISDRFGLDHQELRSHHIEDDMILQKQNASNQMRQNAVIAAAASQQKVRLSATERLAMSAKRPPVNQNPYQTHTSLHQRRVSSSGMTQQQQQSQPSAKPASMPTLETLLAVQRQLQQHTRQNLNSVPQNLVKQNQPMKQDGQQMMVSLKQPQHCISQASTNCTASQKEQPNKPSTLMNGLPAQTTISETNATLNHDIDTYDKDLPPLPQSISPSTNSSDDSQMNSLESHQSSPATSLVSIPPPPPPISSYLQQYDEVTTNQLHSNASTPSTIASSDVSSVRQFPPVKLQNSTNNYQRSPITLDHHLDSFKFPAAPKKQASPPPIAPKPNLALSRMKNKYLSLKQTDLHNCYSNQKVSDGSNQAVTFHPPESPKSVSAPLAQIARRLETQSHQTISSLTDHAYPSQQNSVQQSTIQRNSHTYEMKPSSLMPPPPPPPPPSSFVVSQQQHMSKQDQGSDQPDSGSFRFPSPPPQDLLLDEGDDQDDGVEILKQGDIAEDDDDFQCRIPTPPPHKAIPCLSTATFQPDLQQQQVQTHQRQSSSQQLQQQLFSSSTFTAPINNSVSPIEPLQPPPLFRQHQHQQNQTAIQTVQPQLTVHINNEGAGGLLSTAAAAAAATNAIKLDDKTGGITDAPNNQQLQQTQLQQHQSVSHHHHHHHHHMMMTMAASSSSPSSSSDGDGHSSNSSSSTSGIHSSIDSPSSSNSKLDDFNYISSKGKLQTSHSFSASSCHESAAQASAARMFRKITSALAVHPSAMANGIPQPPQPVAATMTNPPATTKPRPALKQKKSVSFSDKVELVACAEEQVECHLPNPLLARVLAGKLQ